MTVALRRFILSEASNQKPVGKNDMRVRQPTPLAFYRPGAWKARGKMP
jgi:hypothetical protein